MIFKDNILLKFIIFSSIILLACFIDFYNTNFSYVKQYNEIIEKCGQSGKNPNAKICKHIKTDKQVAEMKKVENPTKKYKQYDAITLTCVIVENGIFNFLQLLSPLIIIIFVIRIIHKDFSSGMIKNYLTRLTYKKYLSQRFITIAKISLFFPCVLTGIFLVSCIVTRFNFQINPVIKEWSVYSSWKYNNFIVYGLIICLVQFLLSFAYGCIGFVCCRKNRNFLVSIVMGYIYSLFVIVFVYVVVYSLIINKIFHIKELSDYFNFMGYWFFDNGTSLLAIIAISFIFAIVIFTFTYIYYKNKERTIIENEKQNA